MQDPLNTIARAVHDDLLPPPGWVKGEVERRRDGTYNFPLTSNKNCLSRQHWLYVQFLSDGIAVLSPMDVATDGWLGPRPASIVYYQPDMMERVARLVWSRAALLEAHR